MPQEEKGIQQKWTLYICDECGEPGWEFHRHGDCEYGTGRHHGKHGGRIEVMPVKKHNEVVEGLRAQLEEALRDS